MSVDWGHQRELAELESRRQSRATSARSAESSIAAELAKTAADLAAANQRIQDMERRLAESQHEAVALASLAAATGPQQFRMSSSPSDGSLQHEGATTPPSPTLLATASSVQLVVAADG